MQKVANAEYFKDGGGPLFPGSSTPNSSSQYPTNLQIVNREN
jgi:hypothetical protein